MANYYELKEKFYIYSLQRKIKKEINSLLSTQEQYKYIREHDFMRSNFGLKDIRMVATPLLRKKGKIFMGSSSQAFDFMITQYVKQLEILSRFTKKDLVGEYKKYRNIYKKTEPSKPIKEPIVKRASGYDFLTRKRYDEPTLDCNYSEKTLFPKKKKSEEENFANVVAMMGV